MENTLLIGLSRQMTLERQIDVISNNVANMNTTGFKADNSRFQEYMMPVARADNFVGRDRQLSYVQDTASWRDYSGGPNERTDNPLNVAIDGNGFLAVQTPAGERYTRTRSPGRLDRLTSTSGTSTNTGGFGAGASACFSSAFGRMNRK